MRQPNVVAGKGRKRLVILLRSDILLCKVIFAFGEFGTQGEWLS